MAGSIARTYFPSQLSKLEKRRQAVMSGPLSMNAINSLLSMKFNNKPLFDSIENFYTEEYKAALKNHSDPSELEKVEKFRPATNEEANLLFTDIHAREEREQYISSTNSSDT